MNNLSTRLMQCFSAVFPDLTEEQILAACLTSVPKWDSIATITLIFLIEEEFKLQIGTDEVGNLISFEAVLKVLKKHAPLS